MMPVQKLPLAPWQTALRLGFVSAVFDSIRLKQGGYDWCFRPTRSALADR
jgi:hypothetical protein